jgi:NodT family efflux transporter outer membrane factor (OMF) lipoprotein
LPLIATLIVAIVGCVPKPPTGLARAPNRELPETFVLADAHVPSAGLIDWRDFFTDPHLVALIEAAVEGNQELDIRIQESLIAQSEVMARRGEYLPRVGLGAGAGVEHVGVLTSQGQSDEMAGIGPTLQDYGFGLYASWELDVWGRLRDLAKASALQYLGSLEGRDFVVTQLVSEIASTYFELLALDRQLQLVSDNIALQENALETVRAQFQAGRATSLAPVRFEAELRDMQSARFAIQQRIVETENQLNFLVGRFPQRVERAPADSFLELEPPILQIGVPSELLANRPDVRQAELELEAAGLEVEAARKAFYPALGIHSALGYEAYDLTRLVATPDSLLFGLFADAMAPVLNRKGIKADYFSANSREMQAVLRYERTVLVAVIEVTNRQSLTQNLRESYGLKKQQVERLVEAIAISNDLFNSGRADYLEVLTTRRESLEAQQELIEMKQQQLVASVTLYQALGGGWRGHNLAPTVEEVPR